MFRRLPPAGLCMALLALLAQLWVGGIAGGCANAAGVRPAEPQLAVLAALLPGADILCHSPDDASAPMAPAQHHPHGDCSICPLCVAFAHPQATLTADPFVPPPLLREIGLAAPPPRATAPPRLASISAQPRAPPTLI